MDTKANNGWICEWICQVGGQIDTRINKYTYNMNVYTQYIYPPSLSPSPTPTLTLTHSPSLSSPTHTLTHTNTNFTHSHSLTPSLSLPLTHSPSLSPSLTSQRILLTSSVSVSEVMVAGSCWTGAMDTEAAKASTRAARQQLSEQRFLELSLYLKRSIRKPNTSCGHDLCVLRSPAMATGRVWGEGRTERGRRER